jgi:uncharacterized protein
MTSKPKSVQSGSDAYELSVDPSWQPFLERVLTGTTRTDREIDAMELPPRLGLIRLAVRALRWYRTALSPKLGHRCVFEPTCSRYAELVIRRNGILFGVAKTSRRLCRCRPGAGGVDLP